MFCEPLSGELPQLDRCYSVATKMLCTSAGYCYVSLSLSKFGTINPKQMATSKHFLQDRTVLMLVSVSAFLALATVVLVLLKLGGSGGATNYIISYRASLGIDRYATGTGRDILSFVVAAGLIFTTGVTMSYRSYTVKRELSLTVLALTLPLLVLLLAVSDLLLRLR